MIITKDLDKKVYGYIGPCGGTPASVVWLIIESYHRTLFFMTGQAVFGGDMLFNLMSAVDWHIITARKQRQADIDNVCENSRQVRHDCAVGNIVYV